jgi:hypothetical protein
MLHEDLQTDIVCEDRLACTGARRGSIHRRRHVRRRRVQLGQQEPRLTPALVANDVSWNWETVHKKILGGKEGQSQYGVG